MKLTRKQISEGLESTPIEAVLLGASRERNRLTHKQRKFAEAIAKGETKAAAYRAAYNTQAQPSVQSHEGTKLMRDPRISMQVDALILAEEARKHATPAALRALVIERLTQHAIDDTINPAQRLRALELLGKVTEVAAFTERREVVQHTDASSARARLLEMLRSAVQASATDAGSGLLEELTRGDVDPTVPPPARAREGAPAAAMHSVPHIESEENNDPPPSLPKRDFGETPPLESQTVPSGGTE